jgi:hypothetical protein
MQTPQEDTMPNLSRRELLIASTLTALASRSTLAQTPVASPLASPAASPVAMGGSLSECSMIYDVGSELSRGEVSRAASDEQFYRDELTAIRDQLHCRNVAIYGSVPEQLVAGLDTAADLGFDIRLQTRLNFIPQAEMVDRLTSLAAEAERVRQHGISIVLDVGCEYLIFSDDLLKGDNFAEKIGSISAPDFDWGKVLQHMADMLTSLSETARANFGGAIAYSDTPDKPVELWGPFDIIGIDHYLSSANAATYVETIDTFAQSGKPVWVDEFGCPAWKGASDDTGMAWNIVDGEANPPHIKEGIVRDEDEQARSILDALGLIDQSMAERAYLNEFITAEAVYSDDPLTDWDLTGYGIVTVFGEDSEHPYETTGYWEKKVAFDQVAAWNATR